MIRATTGGVLRSYRTNLMNSFIRDNSAWETVLSQRVFNSYAEDPAAAAKAFRLRKARITASGQLDVANGAYHKFQSAWTSLDTVDKLIDTQNGSGSALSTLKTTTLEWLNDPEGDARTQLAKVLDNLGDTIVQQMNQKYGDDFIFAGADGHNVPFEVREVDGLKKLYYRGVSVDAAVPKVLENNGAKLCFDPATGRQVAAGAEKDTDLYLTSENIKTISADSYNQMTNADAPLIARDTAGKAIQVNASGKLDPAGGHFLVINQNSTITKKDYDQAGKDAEKLDYLMKEKRFIDIGLGMQEDENGKLIESSAFNESLNGLTFLGYGLDKDGDPKNIYSIVQKLKELSDSVPEGGDWKVVWDDFNRLVGKLETASSEFKTQYTNMDAGSQKLENNISLLTENIYNLKEQYSELEDVNMADAITSFIWAEYCYNAALKVGNSILSQSLMDYLQ